jgi:hypothetical protein
VVVLLDTRQVNRHDRLSPIVQADRAVRCIELHLPEGVAIRFAPVGEIAANHL